MQENKNNDIQNFDVDKKNCDNQQNITINYDNIECDRIIFDNNGYIQSLISNIYSTPYIITFLLILRMAAIEHQTTPYETGSDWALMFLIVLFGPGQIISLILSGIAISKYTKSDKKGISFNRKYMNVMNVINILLACLLLTYVFIIMIGGIFFGN